MQNQHMHTTDSALVKAINQQYFPHLYFGLDYFLVQLNLAAQAFMKSKELQDQCDRV